MSAEPGGPIAPGDRLRLPRADRRRARSEDFETIARVRATLRLVEPKWSVTIIVLLASGIRRHARLLENVPGLSKKVLTATLRTLEDNGIVAREVYGGIPVRVEYTLTPLGWRLTEPLMALYEWAVANEGEIERHRAASRIGLARPHPGLFRPALAEPGQA